MFIDVHIGSVCHVCQTVSVCLSPTYVYLARTETVNVSHLPGIQLIGESIHWHKNCSCLIEAWTKSDKTMHDLIGQC